MSDVPAAAVRLEAKAVEAGWKTRTRRATGEWKDKPIELIVMWLHRDGEQLVAAWENGKFASAWQAWLPTQPEGGVSPRRIGSRELTAVVTG